MIPQVEYRSRIRKLQGILARNSIDCLLITPGTDFSYLFGGKTVQRERLILGILPSIDSKEDILRLLCPRFEKERLQETTIFEDFIPWNEDEDPIRKVVPFLDGSKHFAVDGKMRFDFFDKISKMKTGEFVSATPFLEKLRVIKSSLEISYMKKAAKMTVEAIKSSLEIVKPGLTEKEVKQVVLRELKEKSGENGDALVQIGPNSAIPHGAPGERKLESQDVLLIDAGTTSMGYFADITVTVPIGEPTKKFKSVYEIVLEANKAGVEICHEGVPAENVDYTTRSVIEKAGYGPQFTHRTGHGLGLEIHEPPYIVKGNPTPLRSGMVFTVEPGIYLPSKFGVRIEDNVVLTDNGSEMLVEVPRDF